MTEEQIKAKAKEQFPNDEFDQQIVIDAINWATKELQEELKENHWYEMYKLECLKMKELEAQIEKMRNCQNCCHCNGGITDEAGNSICDSCDDDMSMWEY